jgi:hypothetical protein
MQCLYVHGRGGGDVVAEGGEGKLEVPRNSLYFPRGFERCSARVPPCTFAVNKSGHRKFYSSNNVLCHAVNSSRPCFQSLEPAASMDYARLNEQRSSPHSHQLARPIFAQAIKTLISAFDIPVCPDSTIVPRYQPSQTLRLWSPARLP